MNRTGHPKAETLAFLIHSTALADQLEYATYEVIAEYMSDYSDEWKADLYARIADTVRSTDSLPDMVTKVNAALWANQNQMSHA